MGELVCLALAAGPSGRERDRVGDTADGQEGEGPRYPASDCSYCHSFDMAHMRERAKTMASAT